MTLPRLPTCCRMNWTARVIVIAVAQDHAIQMLDSQGMQGRHHGRIAQIEAGREAHTGVVDERVIAGTHDHGQTLTDIEHEHLERAVVQRRTCWPKQRQQQ